jgi:hypothetical protein
MPSPFDRLVRLVGPERAIRAMALYPPYLGAGVRVVEVGPGLRHLTVAMPLRGWNKNAVGTHFGGSLYSMCDPWFMLLLMMRLGRDFIVWDKSASIDFQRPGRGTVRATFGIDDAIVAAIRDEATSTGRSRPQLVADVVADDGTVVARVHKTLSVKPKPPRAPA